MDVGAASSFAEVSVGTWEVSSVFSLAPLVFIPELARAPPALAPPRAL